MVVLSFFEIMADDSMSALRLPRHFVKKFEGVFPDEVILETKYGESWSIKIEKVGEDYFFKHGWAHFVKYYKLEKCDLLHFKPIPEENLAFRVIMFGPSACEKELSFDTQSDSQSNSDPKNIAEHQEDTSSSSTFTAAQDGKMKGVKKKRPSFVLRLTKYTKYRICIPVLFSKKHKLNGKKKMKLQNSNGESWRVKLLMYHRNKQTIMALGRGWFKFWTDNGLKLGGRCALELIPDSNCFRAQLL